MNRLRTVLGVVAAVTGLVAAAGVVDSEAQGPWNAPPDAKGAKNPANGVGNAMKSIEVNCVSCHGPGGKGDGPAAQALNPKPADWTSPAVQAQSDGELFWKISRGRGAMPPWPQLPEKERWEIVNYIRTLKK